MSETRPIDDGRAKPLAPPVPRRAPWRRIVFGLVILVCGAGIGAGGGTIVTKKTSRQRMWNVYRYPHRAPEYLADRLKEDLDLSPSQAEEVKQIVARRMGTVRAILDQTRPQRDEQYELMGKEVAEVLNDEQARAWEERFSKIISSRQSRRSSDRGSRGDSSKRDGNGSRDDDSDDSRSNSKDHERLKDRSAAPKKHDASERAGSA